MRSRTEWTSSRAGMRWKSCKESKICGGNPSSLRDLPVQFAQGFDFQVAPGATRLAGLVQPMKLGLDASSELASSFPSAAGGEESCFARLVPFSARAGSGHARNRCAASPNAARWSAFREARAYQYRHFHGRGGGRDRANAPYSCPKQTLPLSGSCHVIENKASSMPVAKV